MLAGGFKVSWVDGVNGVYSTALTISHSHWFCEEALAAASARKDQRRLKNKSNLLWLFFLYVLPWYLSAILMLRLSSYWLKSGNTTDTQQGKPRGKQNQKSINKWEWTKDKNKTSPDYLDKLLAALVVAHSSDFFCFMPCHLSFLSVSPCCWSSAITSGECRAISTDRDNAGKYKNRLRVVLKENFS